MEIIIDNLKCPSWNDLQRRHWSFQTKMMAAVKGLVVAETRSQIPAKLRSGKSKWEDLPLSICIIAQFTGSNRRDCDNLYVKPIIDALVFAKVIPDDNSDVVRSVTLMAETKCEKDRVIIQLHP